MSKKIPLSFSDEFLRETEEVARLIGLSSQVYGWIPQTLRFSITLSLETLKKADKDIPGLKGEKLDLFFQAIKRSRALAEIEENHKKELEKVAKV